MHCIGRGFSADRRRFYPCSGIFHVSIVKGAERRYSYHRRCRRPYRFLAYRKFAVPYSSWICFSYYFVTVSGRVSSFFYGTASPALPPEVNRIPNAPLLWDGPLLKAYLFLHFHKMNGAHSSAFRKRSVPSP